MQPTYYNRFGYRPPRKRGIKSIIATFSTAVGLLAYTSTVLLWPLQTLQAEPTVINQQPVEEVAIEWPEYGQSAVYAQGYGTLGTNGSDKAVPMASITKIVTALTVLEKRPLAKGSEGASITFTDADVKTYDAYLSRLGSVAPVTPGKNITQRDTLDVMLGISANNYADKMAIWAFGSLDAYLVAANQYLADHNLHDTKVADASGFSPKSRSTASDLVRLGSLALAEPAIATAVNSRKVAVPGYGTVNNTSRLLQQDNEVIGIKTGTTDEAGSCLLYAKKFMVDGQELVIIGATLGAPNHIRLAADAAKVLASIRNGFETTTIAAKGTPFATYDTPWGETIRAVAANEVRGLTWKGGKPTPGISVDDMGFRDLPVKIGAVVFTQGQQTVATASLELESPAAGPDWLWRIAHPGTVFGL